MGKDSKIEHVRCSYSPWFGCTRRSRGCLNCYAERMIGQGRFARVKWGAGQPRVQAGDRKGPYRWAREAAKEGRRWRVMTNALGELFDPEVPQAWRDELWQVIADTGYALDWFLTTKCPEHVAQMVPPAWMAGGWPDFACLMVTCEDQIRADDRMSILYQIPAPRRGLMIEPLLGEIDLLGATIVASGGIQNSTLPYTAQGQIDWGGWLSWVVVGLESGAKARSCGDEEHPEESLLCVRDLIAQCQQGGIPVFVKQLGSVWAKIHHAQDWRGADPSEWPEDLRVQEPPR